MLKNIAVDCVVETKIGPGKVRKVGSVMYGGDSRYGWAILTLDVNGQVAYCVVREDELAIEPADSADSADSAGV